MEKRLICSIGGILTLLYFVTSTTATNPNYAASKKILQHLENEEAESDSYNNLGNRQNLGSYSETDYVPKVTIDDLGTARGTVMISALKRRDFYAFFSIPYAKPPVNDLRFKNTVEWSGKWSRFGEYDATYLRARCPQSSMVINHFIGGDEDCLHLSIFTPKKPEEVGTNKLPVMVFIHGGGYTSGDASLYVPTKLMDKEVMVVVVQYRLSTLGFIYSGTDNAPGNMGLYDQITALRWIQDYITDFGGDRKKVTVFGQSAGGASTSWLTLTPLTNATHNTEDRGQLIHGAIPMSGSALEYWTLDNDYQNSLIDHALAYDPPCYEDNFSNDDIIDCMRARPVTEVIKAANSVYIADRKNAELGFRGMCPVVQDSDKITVEKVIPKDPHEVLDEGSFLRVNVMPGSVRDEGSLVVALTYAEFLYPDYVNDTEFLRDDLIDRLMLAFGIVDGTGSIRNVLEHTFLEGVEMGNLDAMIPGMVDMTGMFFLKSGAWTMAHKVAKAAPEVNVYFYSFEFESDDSLFDWMFMGVPNLPVEGGIGHADDLLYLFYLPSYQTEREKLISDRHSTLWSNFAIWGNPTPTKIPGVDIWQPFTIENKEFMLMKDDYTMDTDFTRRWTYHSVNKQNGVNKAIEEKGKDTKVIEINTVELNDDSTTYKIVMGVLSGVLGCAVLTGVIYTVIILRRKNNGNF